MNNQRRNIRFRLYTLVTISSGVLLGSEVNAQTLLLDEFAGSGIVDPTVYRLPFGAEGNFVGRTQFNLDSSDLPMQGQATTVGISNGQPGGSTDGLVAVLTLDTFDPGNPGAQFLGTDLITKQNFARSGGLRMETRMRIDTSQGGLVAAPFLFDVSRDADQSLIGTDLIRDEIDHEILSNNIAGGTPHATLTNVWDEGPFTGAGAGGTPVTIPNSGSFDVREFHDYRTDWTPTKVEYYIDGLLVRTESTTVPDDPMKAHWNFWAPDSTFVDAFDGSLNPDATGPGTTFRAEIDRIEITQFNTTTSANLLTDPSFENGTTTTDPTATDAWFGFNNAFLESGGGVPTVTGVAAAKAFGPFAGSPDASGWFQNVSASPGEEFEGRIFGISDTVINGGSDSINGTGNFGSVKIEFLDAVGNVITEEFGGNTISKDSRETAMLDGRDPNLVEDVFVEGIVNAKAPAGTAFARLVLPFVQTCPLGVCEGGALYWDDASLVRLTAAVEDANFDGDSDVDGVDFLTWQRGFGLPGQTDNSNGDANLSGTVDDSDFGVWETQFGATGQLSAVVGASAVPEPTSFGLAICCGSLLACSTRCRRSSLPHSGQQGWCGF